MAKYMKGVAFLLFVVVAFSSVHGAPEGGAGGDGGGSGSGSGSGGGDPQSVLSRLSTPKITKGSSVPLSVEHSGLVASPIQYKTSDYSGPYDPFDPDGMSAASHRALKMTAQKTGENIRSYIPPGLGELAKKEIIKIALAEGNRFALHHPRETNELVGLLIKAKQLFDNAKANVKKQEAAAGSSSSKSSSGSGSSSSSSSASSSSSESGSSSSSDSGSVSVKKVEAVVKVKDEGHSSSNGSSKDKSGQ